MSDSPKCDECGLEITTGMMPAFCQYADNCEMWPHSDGTPAGDSAELFMAKAWIRTACEQLGMQMRDRERLRDAIQRVLDDEESRPGGWGPDVTCVSILREALNPQSSQSHSEKT